MDEVDHSFFSRAWEKAVERREYCNFMAKCKIPFFSHSHKMRKRLCTFILSLIYIYIFSFLLHGSNFFCLQPMERNYTKEQSTKASENFSLEVQSFFGSVPKRGTDAA